VSVLKVIPGTSPIEAARRNLEGYRFQPGFEFKSRDPIGHKRKIALQPRRPQNASPAGPSPPILPAVRRLLPPSTPRKRHLDHPRCPRSRSSSFRSARSRSRKASGRKSLDAGLNPWKPFPPRRACRIARPGWSTRILRINCAQLRKKMRAIAIIWLFLVPQAARSSLKQVAVWLQRMIARSRRDNCRASRRNSL